MTATPKLRGAEARPFEVDRIREEFPVLHQEVNGRPPRFYGRPAAEQKGLPVRDGEAN